MDDGWAVTKTADGWLLSRDGRPVGAAHGSEDEAVEHAREAVAEAGGGELVVEATGGRRREKIEVGPGLRVDTSRGERSPDGLRAPMEPDDEQ